MEAGIATQEERQSRSERFQTAGNSLAGMAVEQEHRRMQTVQEVGPVITEAAVEQIEESRRFIPAEAADNGMGM